MYIVPTAYEKVQKGQERARSSSSASVFQRSLGSVPRPSAGTRSLTALLLLRGGPTCDGALDGPEDEEDQ
eukprot:6684284-Pyramimonas_sp.AAC.1